MPHQLAEPLFLFFFRRHPCVLEDILYIEQGKKPRGSFHYEINHDSWLLTPQGSFVTEREAHSSFKSPHQSVRSERLCYENKETEPSPSPLPFHNWSVHHGSSPPTHFDYQTAEQCPWLAFKNVFQQAFWTERQPPVVRFAPPSTKRDLQTQPQTTYRDTQLRSRAGHPQHLAMRRRHPSLLWVAML